MSNEEQSKMLPILDLGFVQIQSYPFFWGLAWGIAFYRLISSVKCIETVFHFFALFLISWLSSKYFFDLSGGSFTFSSGLGFVFYGGLLGSSLYVFILYALKNEWIKKALPQMIMILPLSHAIGRIGCFMTGCCYGVFKFPIQIIEATMLLIIYIIIRRNPPNTVFNLASYFFLYGSSRLILELFRNDSRGLWLNLPPSIWLSIICVLLGFFFYSRGRRNC